jgi:PAT family acetyl-CoA transporter-like MFS transporter 1
MSSSEQQGSTRRRHQGSPKTPARNMAANSDSPHPRSSSLQRNQANIRPLHSANGHNYGREEEDEVELSLLGEQERRQAALGVDSADVEQVREKPNIPLSTKDKKAMALLIILCTHVSNGIYSTSR